MKNVVIHGETLPAVGMGSWRLGQGRHPAAQEQQALQYGLSQGLKVIDTAEMYGDGASEQLIGDALKGRRDECYLVSKVYPWHAAPRKMITACEQSLQRLQTDCLDLYLLHWASETPLDEIIDGFKTLQQQGKIKQWGVSNFDTAAMQELWRTPGGDQCRVNQVFYNPQYRGIEYSLLPWCAEHQVTVMGYSPLGGHGSDLLHDPLVIELADKHQISSAALLLRWAIRDGNMLVVPESGSSSHIAGNCEALKGALSADDLAALDARFPPPQRETPLEIR